MVEVVILAGGQGTRLREVVSHIPKPLAPVGGRPFLEYLVLYLKRFGIRKIVISTGYMAEKIRAYFGNGERWGIDIIYSHELQPLGTGGAIREASELIDGKNFIVMNGDSIINLDINQFLDVHESKGALVTMSLIKKKDVKGYGVADINNDGKILCFMEKGKAIQGLINGGVYVIEKKIIELMPEGNISLEYTILPSLAGYGLYGMVTSGFFVDIGTPKNYLQVCNNPEMLERLIQEENYYVG